MAVGTHKGYVQIWDAAAGKKLSVLEGHTARVGELREAVETEAEMVTGVEISTTFICFLVTSLIHGQ